MTKNICNPAPRKPFLRFLSVGVLNTLVGLSIIYAAKAMLGMADGWANACGYAVGLCVSFTLNRNWTFGHRGAIVPAAMRFLAVAAMAYAMNLLTVMWCIHSFNMNSYLAQALGVPPYTLTSFILSRLWAFRAESAT